MTTFSKVLMVAAALGAATAVQAAPSGGTGGATGGPVMCQVNYAQALYSTGMQNADSCMNGTATNDFLNPLQVNTEQFFGFTDWVYLGKDEQVGGSPNGTIGLNVTGIGGLSGTWSVTAGSLANYQDFMIVLKAGTEFAGFLFGNTNTSSGNWGYVNTPGLSHLTLYARGTGNGGGGGGGGGNPVPEPGMIGLLGLGLLGVAAARRRKA